MRRSGRQSCKRRRAREVVSTTSPIERRRMINTSAPRGRLGSSDEGFRGFSALVIPVNGGHQASFHRRHSRMGRPNQARCGDAHAIERFGNHVMDKVQLLRRDHVGRKNVHHVSERPQQNAFAEIEIVKGGAQLREIAGIVGLEFHRHHRAQDADIADGGVVLQRARALVVNFSMAAMRSNTGSESKIFRLAIAAAQPSGFAVYECPWKKVRLRSVA